tara:strand:+ start:155 stop:427 length:273 start_codon:yes stop_codon:yes gene_type:complete
MPKLGNFETVKLVQALTTINDFGVNQSILLEIGSIEMIKNTGEGTYSVYYTDDNGDVDYVCTSQTYSMTGAIADVLFSVNQYVQSINLLK